MWATPYLHNISCRFHGHAASYKRYIFSSLLCSIHFTHLEHQSSHRQSITQNLLQCPPYFFPVHLQLGALPKYVCMVSANLATLSPAVIMFWCIPPLHFWCYEEPDDILPTKLPPEPQSRGRVLNPTYMSFLSPILYPICPLYNLLSYPCSHAVLGIKLK